jgi:hypothetical protein
MRGIVAHDAGVLCPSYLIASVSAVYIGDGSGNMFST